MTSRSPVPTDAIQWDGTNACYAQLQYTGRLVELDGYGNLSVWVESAKTLADLQRGDWIIRDGSGFNVCKQNFGRPTRGQESPDAPPARRDGRHLNPRSDRGHN